MFMTEKVGGSEETIAVVVVDVQGDFTEARNGSLAVPDTGGLYIEAVEAAVRRLGEARFLIVGTQDWHPKDHISFHPNHPGKGIGDVIQVDGRTQVLWPPHCVQGTEGARVLVDNSLFREFVRKGPHPGFDSYSAFRDDGGNETELDGILLQGKVRKVVAFGLATDYCVKHTVLDGLRKGYRLIVVEALCRGITPTSTHLALDEMRSKGAITLNTLDIDKIRVL
jgi:nicotinamidase/pyrazinamidase